MTDETICYAATETETFNHRWHVISKAFHMWLVLLVSLCCVCISL